MKPRLLFCFTLALCFSASVLAQTPNQQLQSAGQPFSHKATSFSGRVSDDAKFFIAEPGAEVWTVTNPELLKTHAGERVLLQVQTASATKTLRVLCAKPEEAELHVARQSDSAFRR